MDHHITQQAVLNSPGGRNTRLPAQSPPQSPHVTHIVAGAASRTQWEPSRRLHDSGGLHSASATATRVLALVSLAAPVGNDQSCRPGRPHLGVPQLEAEQMQAYSFGCKAALHGQCTSCCSDLSSPSHQLTVMAGPSVTPTLHPARTGTRPRTAAMGSRAAAMRALKLARSQAPEEEHEDHKATGSHLDCSARMHLEPLDWDNQCHDVRCGVLRRPRGQAGRAYLKKVWKETKDLG